MLLSSSLSVFFAYIRWLVPGVPYLTQTGYTVTDVTAKHSFLKIPELKAMAFSHLQVNDKKYRCLLNVALT